MKAKTSKKNKKKLVAVIIAAVLVVSSISALGYFVYIKPKMDKPSETPIQKINLEPPTQQELKESESIKKNSVDPSNTTSNTSSVTVVVSNTYNDGTSLEIRAFVPGIIESNGTCMAELSKGSNKFSANSKAFADATTTQCETIIIPLANFAEKGTWNLNVKYTSSKSSGTSANTEVEI